MPTFNFTRLIAAASLSLVVCHASPALAKGDENKVEAFALDDVRITSQTFLTPQRLATDYILGLDADRLLAPYYKEAGLKPLADNYPNWESMGLDGHICGHYLSALAHMYAATGDARLKERLDYTVARLAECQAAAGDGYISGVPNGREMWNRVFEGAIDAGAFSLNGKWVPLYNIHKPLAGLRDAYLVGGCRQAQSVFENLCDWFEKGLSKLNDTQLQTLLVSEHGGLNEIFADAYEMLGSTRYLTMAKRMTHNVVLNPLLEQADKLDGMHANTQIPKIIGIERIASLAGDDKWHRAADFFWHEVAEYRSVSIGGNSVREHFNPKDNFASMIESEQGPETCNTYNMLRLTKLLFLANPEASYMDFYERAMLNHILSTISTKQGGFVYFTPMRPGHYRVYSQPQTSFWCCVGSGIENHSRYAEMIYAHVGEQTLYVNTFLPSRLNWERNRTNVEIEGNFPWTDKVTLTIDSKKAKLWTLKIRKPHWAPTMTVTMPNGTQYTQADADGYIAINQTWAQGKTAIEISMPMSLSAEQLPDHSSYYSLLYGPMVLAADMGREGQTGLYADDSRGGHIAAGKKMDLGDVISFVGDPTKLVNEVERKGTDWKWSVKKVWPEKYESFELVPFVSLSEHRYQVYFSVLTEDELADNMATLKAREEERKQLEAQTTDLVICGEQQPETDHQMTGEATNQGSDEGNVHWRETSGWFAYKLKATGTNRIQVTFKRTPSTSGRLFVDGREVGQLPMGAEGKRSITVNIDPSAKEYVEVRIEASSALSPRVYEVRALK